MLNLKVTGTPGIGWQELALCCNFLYPKGLPRHGEGLKLNRIAKGGTDVAFPVASLPVANQCSEPKD